MTALNSSGSAPAMPLVTWSQLMFTIAPPPACSRITAPAAYEHAMVPLRSTASSRSSLRSQSQLGLVAGEHVGAGVVDPHVEAAQALVRLRDERLAARRACRGRRARRARGRPLPRCRRRPRPRPPHCGGTSGARSRRRRRTPWRSPAPMPLLAPVTTVRAPSRRGSHGCGVGSGVTTPRRFPRRTGAALRPRRRGCPAGWAGCRARGRWTPSWPGSCSRRSSCRRPPPSG